MTVMITNDRVQFAIDSTHGGVASDCSTQPVTEESTVLTASETMSRNAVANTSAKLKMRVRTKRRNPMPGVGSISQILFKAPCNSPKIPDAPIRSVTAPMTVAMMPAWVSFALSVTEEKTSRPCFPISDSNCAPTWVLAASSPKTSAVTAVRIKMSGANANDV